MKTNAAGLALAALAVTGCSSVDQVPLVYVSTAKVGVNVESGSAETPGASIMIGVDLTDAAYVPVAVARKCDSVTADMIEECVDSKVGILRILGNADSISEDMRERMRRLATDADSLKRDLSSADRAYALAVEEERKAGERVDAARSSLDLKQTLETERASLAEQGLLFERADELEQATAEAQTLAAREALLSSRERDRKRARDDLDKLFGDLSALSGRLEAAIPRGGSDQLAQSDALSVFGTFKGHINSGTGPTPTATVGLGKSFSTGIAAQNLTRGVGEASGRIAKAECVASVTETYKAMTPAEKAQSPLAELVKACIE